MTVVLVTHEADVARHARRVVRFRDGRVLSDDAPGAARGARGARAPPEAVA